MVSSLTDHQRVVFENAAFHAAQVRTSKVAAHFIQTTLEGKQKFFQIYAAISLEEKTVRGQKTVFQETTRSRRAISARTFSFTEFFDEDDEINLMSDAGPNQDLIEGYAAAGARKKDEIMIEGLLGTAKSGETGADDVVFDTTNQEIDVSGTGGGGVTLTDLLDGIEKLRSASIDPSETVFGIISPLQLRLFQGIDKLTNQDFQDIRALVTGGAGNWMDVTWLVTPTITKHEKGDKFAPGFIDGTNEFALILATKLAGVIGMTRGTTSMKLSERPDLSDGHQLRVKGVMAATRLFENRVVRFKTKVGATPASTDD